MTETSPLPQSGYAPRRGWPVVATGTPTPSSLSAYLRWRNRLALPDESTDFSHADVFDILDFLLEQDRLRPPLLGKSVRSEDVPAPLNSPTRPAASACPPLPPSGNAAGHSPPLPEAPGTGSCLPTCPRCPPLLMKAQCA